MAAGRLPTTDWQGRVPQLLCIHEMYGRTGLRLTDGQHRFEHQIPEHTLTAEFGEQRRMGVQNPRRERG
jgi:hypothetical protein